jgi:hypothetical protein
MGEIIHNREFCRGFSSPDECCGCPNCTATEHVPGCHFALERGGITITVNSLLSILTDIRKGLLLPGTTPVDTLPTAVREAMQAAYTKGRLEGFAEANTLWQTGRAGRSENEPDYQAWLAQAKREGWL